MQEVSTSIFQINKIMTAVSFGGIAVFIGCVDHFEKNNRSNSSCANHSDEPLRAKIMSAEASIIFEFHLHCTKIELERLFFSKWSFYSAGKNCRKLCKGDKTGDYKGRRNGRWFVCFG